MNILSKSASSANVALRPEAAGKPWIASMIHPAADQGVGTQGSFVRKTFSLNEVAKDATLRISALGLYRCFINGVRVGNDQLTPGWTCYHERLSFQTYDVASLLREGENTIDIWLGDGWYRSKMLWEAIALVNTWGDKIGAIAELSAGDAVLVKTDTSWTSGLLPITKSGIYYGENYDARQEGLPASQPVSVIASFDPAALLPHETGAVKELAALPVVNQFSDAEGRTIYDFGQNCGGYTAFTVEGNSGDQVIVEYAEILDMHGNFSNENMRSAETRIEYTLKGGAPESYRPTFTFHGYRYARVTVSGAARILSIVSVPISSATIETGTLTTGHPLVNRLVENTRWSQRSNFIEVPTDCPQRDERLGWTGDAQVFAPTACYLFNSQTFLTKWLRDLMADQRPGGEIPHVCPDPTRNHEDLIPGFYGSTGWGDAISIIPYVLYKHYADRRILEETLPAMTRWVDFLWSISDGPIVRPPRQWGARGFSFGDWLQPSGPTDKPLPTIGDDAAATIYLYISSVQVAKIATILGDDATARRMSERAEAVKAAFQYEFITPSGRVANDDQTSYALAILHDLIPADKLEAVRGYFKATIARTEGRIGTGFIGTPALLPALVKIGETELAASVFLQEKVPGWLYQVKRGATTIWERWDAIKEDGSVFDPQMNSYNHYAYGAVCQWLFEAVAGLQPDAAEPGFKHVIFEPLIIPALSPVSASYASAAGPVAASWSLSGNKVTYEVTVPEGSTASLKLRSNYTNPQVNGQTLSGRLPTGKHVVTFDIANS